MPAAKPVFFDAPAVYVIVLTLYARSVPCVAVLLQQGIFGSASFNSLLARVYSLLLFIFEYMLRLIHRRVVNAPHFET